MALQKQPININFLQGVDTKTDKFQVQVGKFLELSNSTFDTLGQLKKRNGFAALSALPDATSTFLTTFDNNLTAIGSSVEAYSASNSMWINKGKIQPIKLSTIPTVRGPNNISQVTSAVASNGLVCTAFTVTAGNVSTYQYSIANSVTSQNIIVPTTIVPSSGTVTSSPKVFALGRYFVLVFITTISATQHLQYIAISIQNPAVVTTATDLSASITDQFSGVVANNSLYVAWNGAAASGIKVTYLDSTLAQHGTTNPDAAHTGSTSMSVTADETTPTPTIWISYFSSSTNNGYTLAVDANLNSILAATLVINSAAAVQITTAAQNNILTYLREISATYSYNSVATDRINYSTVTIAGVVSGITAINRGVGLGSKAFIYSGDVYFIATYSSAYQSTYLLIKIDSTTPIGKIVGKLAYGNGIGYLTTFLPQVTLIDNVAYISYLLADTLLPTNKIQGSAASAPFLSQFGANLAAFTFSSDQIGVGEIGANLNITGGITWAYDGFAITEQGFLFWPDNIVIATSTASPTITGNDTNGSNVITNVSAITNVGIGMSITGTGIPANTLITAYTATTITLSKNATSTNTGITLTLTGNVNVAQIYYYQVIYEYTDNQGNIFRSAPSIPVTITTTTTTSFNTISIPTLRATYKTALPVKIQIYRWSTAQQIYYQVTSITTPLLNSTTVDSVSYVDALSDTLIVGNAIIYTNGGVLENIAPPPSDVMTLFDDRLWLIDSEDKNKLWYSKQVLEATPVEMSDLQTLYIAPTIGSQGSTGNLKCLFPMDDKLILFKDTAVYYITGSGPDATGANNQYSQPIFITATVGSANPNSIVFMPNGLMFQSEKGIWLLGRDLSTKYIGAAVEAYNASTVLSAVSVPESNQIRFTLDSGITLMYDYFVDQWATFSGIPAISSVIYNSLHTYLDSIGSIFQETPGAYLDNSRPVLMNFKTAWINLAGIQGFERFYYLLFLGQYLSPFKLQTQIAYNYSPAASTSVIGTPDNTYSTWGSSQLWGSSPQWGGGTGVFKERVFPSIQKCSSFQITVNELYDASQGAIAGAGLTLSSLTLIAGIKKSSRNTPATKSVG